MVKGGSLFSSILSLGAKMLAYVGKAAAKVAPALATGAATALGSLGVDKIFGKGIDIPFEFLPKILASPMMLNELTKKQKELIGSAYQSGRELNFKPTQRQIQGGFLGTLAVIGIPMAIELASKLFGKGLNMPARGRGRGLTVSPKPNLIPFEPLPPFYGTWEGSGSKKKKDSAATVARYTRDKQPIQQHTVAWREALLVLKPTFKDVPLSNFDLVEWSIYLRTPNFRGIFSRDAINFLDLKNLNSNTMKTYPKGSFIINLGDQIGPGTHWVAVAAKLVLKPKGKDGKKPTVFITLTVFLYLLLKNLLSTWLVGLKRSIYSTAVVPYKKYTQ